MSLPIVSLLPEIQATLERSTRLVLVAPPGAGKTTQVPLALLNASWLGAGKIVVLEPRRLAARAAARRMAVLLGERVGESVGYRVHLDTVVGRETRIEVVTEGVLTRMLQSDATLSGISAVLFDEFHERSLHADIGLALTLHAQRHVRDTLRIVLMSATLESERIARALDAPVLRADARAFPVETVYRPRGERERVDAAVSRVAREAIAAPDGDVLCFLPGGAEIRRATEALAQTIADPGVDIRPLYGELPAEMQDAAIGPSIPGRRKIVLATNIAETSLTIEGVRIVIDGGFARAPRFSARTGLTRLETVRISRASADQRRGRAGRTAPGLCYRLWAPTDDAQLAPRTTPEILEADLAPLALELAVAGVEDPSELTWLDAPPAGALAQGRALLERLGALKRDLSATPAETVDVWVHNAGQPRPVTIPQSAVLHLTPHGKAVAALPTHPRIAHMLLRGAALSQGALACDLAALLANRDVLRPAESGGRVEGDLRLRVEALTGDRTPANARVDRDAIRRVRQEAAVWRERLHIARHTTSDVSALGLLLSFAYPDRIARRRDAHGRFQMANGAGAFFAEPQPLGSEEWLVIAETDGRTPDSQIWLSASVALDDLRSHHADAFTTSDDVYWSDDTERVECVQRTRLGEIVISERPIRDPLPERVRAILVDVLRRRGIGALPWSDTAIALRDRLRFLRAQDDAWPDVSDEALHASLGDWIMPLLGTSRSIADISRSDLTAALLEQLDWARRERLDQLAPSYIDVPSGSRVAVDYSEPAAPSVSVRLQELFGLAMTPTVFGGRVPLTLKLLSPAHRPVQVTRDLAAFWRGSYAEVRKEMRGRYPKHDWPEDPAAARPSKGRRKH